MKYFLGVVAVITSVSLLADEDQEMEFDAEVTCEYMADVGELADWSSEFTEQCGKELAGKIFIGLTPVDSDQVVQLVQACVETDEVDDSEVAPMKNEQEDTLKVCVFDSLITLGHESAR